MYHLCSKCLHKNFSCYNSEGILIIFQIVYNWKTYTHYTYNAFKKQILYWHEYEYTLLHHAIQCVKEVFVTHKMFASQESVKLKWQPILTYNKQRIL